MLLIFNKILEKNKKKVFICIANLGGSCLQVAEVHGGEAFPPTSCRLEKRVETDIVKSPLTLHIGCKANIFSEMSLLFYA